VKGSEGFNRLVGQFSGVLPQLEVVPAAVARAPLIAQWRRAVPEIPCSPSIASLALTPEFERYDASAGRERARKRRLFTVWLSCAIITALGDHYGCL